MLLEYMCKNFQLTTSMIMTWPARIGSQYDTATTASSCICGVPMTGEAVECSSIQKGGVMQLRHARGCHMVFWKPVQPLQRVPRLACSVASLSWYPGHQLLKCYSLHCKTLADYLLGKELPSAYTVTHSMQDCIPAPQVTAEPIVNEKRHCLHKC